MYKSEITAFFLIALLFTGALTAAIPSFMENAKATASSDERVLIYKKIMESEDSASNDELFEAVKKYINNVDEDAKSEASTNDEQRDEDAKSEESTDTIKIKYPDSNGDQSSSYNKFYQDYSQKSSGSQDTYPNEKVYYNASSSAGEPITKPSTDDEQRNGEEQSQDQETTSNNEQLEAIKKYINSKNEDAKSEASTDDDEQRDEDAKSEASTDDDEQRDEDAKSEASTDDDEQRDEEEQSQDQEETTSNNEQLEAIKKYLDNINKDAKSEESTDQKEIEYKDMYDNQSSSYDKFYQDYNQTSSGFQDTYPKEPIYYNASSSFGEAITIPSSDTNYVNDYDKKIVVVCPDGSKLPVHRVLTPSPIGIGERALIDNVIQKVCPAIDVCEECFEWILNFANNREEAIAIVNTVIDALNKAPIGHPYLDNVKIGAQGYEGANLWEISQFFNRLFEDDVNQKQALSALINNIKGAVDAKEVTPIVGLLATNIIECIVELEGIPISFTPPEEIPISDNTPTTDNNEQGQKYGVPIPTTSDY
jgi:hypothetical protein